MTGITAASLVYVTKEQARPQSQWGSGQNRNLGGGLTKNILVDIALDNNAFIAFFSGEPEDNYSGEDMSVLSRISVKAQRSMNK